MDIGKDRHDTAYGGIALDILVKPGVDARPERQPCLARGAQHRVAYIETASARLAQAGQQHFAQGGQHATSHHAPPPNATPRHSHSPATRRI